MVHSTVVVAFVILVFVLSLSSEIAAQDNVAAQAEAG